MEAEGNGQEKETGAKTSKAWNSLVATNPTTTLTLLGVRIVTSTSTRYLLWTPS